MKGYSRHPPQRSRCRWTILGTSYEDPGGGAGAPEAEGWSRLSRQLAGGINVESAAPLLSLRPRRRSSSIVVLRQCP